MSKKSVLLDSVQEWERDGLIDEKTRTKLNADIEIRYPNRIFNLVSIFSALGGILIGLGILLLVAYNWDAMTKYVKISVIFSAIAVFHFTGYLCALKKKMWVAEGLWLTGSFVFGAGIALIAQIYHIDENPTNGILLFAAGVTVAAFAYRSIPQSIVCFVALAICVWMELDLIQMKSDSTFFLCNPGIIIALTALYLWYFKRSIILYSGIACYLLACLFIMSDTDGSWSLQSMFLGSILLYATSFLLSEKKQWKGTSKIVAQIAAFYFIIPFFLMTFLGICDDGSYQSLPNKIIDIYISWGLHIFFIFAITIVGWIRCKEKPSLYVSLQHFALPICTLILSIILILIYDPNNQFDDSQIVISICTLFNVLFFLSMVYRIYEGGRTQTLLRMLSATFMLCLWLIFCYISMFESTIYRAIAFLSLGLILYAIAFTYRCFNPEMKRG